MYQHIVSQGDYEAAEKLLESSKDLFNPLHNLTSWVLQKCLQIENHSWKLLSNGSNSFATINLKISNSNNSSCKILDEKRVLLPASRGGHQMAIDSEAQLLYLHGGWNGSNDLSDLWVYDISTGEWSCINTGEASQDTNEASRIQAQEQVLEDSDNDEDKREQDDAMDMIEYALLEHLEANNRSEQQQQNEENNNNNSSSSSNVHEDVNSRNSGSSSSTSNSSAPSARSCHEMKLCTKTKRLYIIGRYIEPELREKMKLECDFWYFDLVTSTWVLLSRDTSVCYCFYNPIFFFLQLLA